MKTFFVNTGGTIYRFVWVSAWYGFAAIVVVIATVFAAARLLLPYADQYSVEISERLSGYIQQPVVVQALDAEWHGWGPSLVLRNVTVLDAADDHPVLQLEKIRLGFDLRSSLRRWQPVFSDIALVGVDFELRRNQRGEYSVAGLVAQQGNVANDPKDTALVTAWLFSQGQLSLEDSNITWRDEMGAGRLMKFTAVNIRLRNDGKWHQLDASLDLARELGKSMVLRVEIRGNPMKADGRRTRLYLAGDHVHLENLFEPQPLAGVNVAATDASFQVWGQWKNGKLQKLNGSSNVGSVKFTPVKPDEIKETLLLDRISAEFEWQRIKDGWQVEVNDLLLVQSSHQWEPSHALLKFTESVEAGAEWNIFASFLQLEDVSQILTLFSVGEESLSESLVAINPRGEIRDAIIAWQTGEIPQYRAYARLQNASLNSWRDIPSAKNIGGQLWLDSISGGQIALQNAAMTLDLPDLFRWPINIDALSGNIVWQQEGENWRVSGRQLEASNKDITAAATLDIVQNESKKSPFMSLLVNFHDGDGSQIERYLPTGIMDVAAIEWLDTAIVDGRIISGGSVFHGRLDDFPFDQKDGQFEVIFAAEKVNLNYAQDWPPANNIMANMRFFGRAMSMEAQQGKILSNDIEWAKINVADMSATPMLLKIKGEVQGLTQEKLDYLLDSPPLYDAFAQHLEGITVGGDSLLNLGLLLPIGNDDPVTVDGWLAMKENSLIIPPLGKVFSEIEGRLQFTEAGLRTKNMQVDLFGQATQLNIVTNESSVPAKIQVRAQGMFEAPDLAARYLPQIKDLLVGDSDWDISFDIPLGGSDGEGDFAGMHHTAILRVRSNLKGIEARLPPPLYKAAEDARSLALRVEFSPKQLPLLRVNYDGFLDGIFALGDVAAKQVLPGSDAAKNSFRGELRLNSGIAELPEAPGVRVTGWLDAASLDDWRNLQLATASTDNTGAPLFNSANIAVREFEAYGQLLHNVRFNFETQKDWLKATIDSKELKGRISIPNNFQTNALKAELDYFYATEVTGGDGMIDPRSIPALDFSIKDFRYNKIKFGSMRLETANVADGLRIEQLVLKPRSTAMTARGGWYMRGKQQSSNLQLHVESSNIRHTLKALDYVGGIGKGTGSADLELTWPGSFADVDAENIKGKLNLSLKDGQLLDVEPGAGRMFGMLSFQTLPRRLLLDFSDVFKKGFGFDRIKGSFTIEDGDAYTNDLYLRGPAARVEISGRTGLAEQDYDQLVTVTPQVSESLPVLGVLAATPQIGVAILAIQNLFKPAIDNATKNQYTITGSWNDPIIKKVKKPVVENVDEDDF